MTAPGRSSRWSGPRPRPPLGIHGSAEQSPRGSLNSPRSNNWARAPTRESLELRGRPVPPLLYCRTPTPTPPPPW
jgi:hypothetical protein